MRTGYSCYCYTSRYARICVAVSVAEIDLQGRNQGLAFDPCPRVAINENAVGARLLQRFRLYGSRLVRAYLRRERYCIS